MLRRFSPIASNAKVGDTAAWINKDIVAHTATVRDGFDVMRRMHRRAWY
jgi:plastocyanin